MTPQENLKREFYGDVRDRKSLVPSARHMKRGSKTKFVSLPHDNMTQGAWKKMNGEVVSYNMRVPMDWATFKGLPADLMKEYLSFLRDEFAATGANIAEVFGVTYSTLNRVMNENEVHEVFHRGAKQPKKEIARMKQFFYPSYAEAEKVVTEETPIPEMAEEAMTKAQETEDSQEVTTPPLFKSNMSKFTMEFGGAYDEKSLVNTMRLMVGQGTVCKIKIVVEKEECSND